MYDIIIVGAGPAGLTSSIYARRAMKKTLILEALNYGGQIINTLSIDNYPANPNISGFDFATKIYNQTVDLGTEIKYEKVIKIKDGKEFKEVITDNNSYKTRTIILATGSINRKLAIDGEQNFIGKGISYCATCDGAFYKGKEVAVVGGGNTALEDALYLADIAKKVYLIHRRDEFRGEEALVNSLKSKSNIKFVYNSNVTKLSGNDKLEAIEITKKDGSCKKITVSGLFVAIGRTATNENFRSVINLDKDGYIIASENCHTNVPGIFVSGDCRVKEVRQLVTATADGAIAAIEAIKFINNK